GRGRPRLRVHDRRSRRRPRQDGSKLRSRHERRHRLRARRGRHLCSSLQHGDGRARVDRRRRRVERGARHGGAPPTAHRLRGGGASAPRLERHGGQVREGDADGIPRGAPRREEAARGARPRDGTGRGALMGKPTGFTKYARQTHGYIEPRVRLKTYDEFNVPPPKDEREKHGTRCMDCGVLFCHSSSGCPVDNLIPEWNDLVYRGEYRAALDRLHKTNNFPEFTGRVCPAPCESACVLGINEPAVAIKSIEMAIVDRGFAEGWIKPCLPEVLTGKKVAIIGSGPAGLTAAQQLARAGH